MQSNVVLEKNTKLTPAKSVLWIIALVVFFSVSMNYEWRTGYIAWYGSLALVLISYVLTFNLSISIKNFSFELWMMSFMALGAVSLFWSISFNLGLDILKSLLVYLVVIMLIHSSVNYGFNINNLIKCYFIGIVINTIYIALTINFEQLGQTQLGANVLEGWNGNGIGFLMAQGALFGLYLFGQSKNKLEKALYVLLVLAFSILNMYTGSRTAFIMLVAEFILMLWLSNPQKIFRNIAITVVSLMAILFVVMTVEGFYNVLGSRLEGLFALFSGEGKVDHSSDIRDEFIENGKVWFAESPLLGKGLNNYRVLNQTATGRFTYAHNNFIEIAVNLGIIGIVWYYSVYVYLAAKLLKHIKNNPLAAFLLTALLASLISQYGTVSYYGLYQNLLMMLCFCAIFHQKERIALR